MVFSWMIKKDSKIPGTNVRATTIPEQLGRISYLLTDKTGRTAGTGPAACGADLPLNVESLGGGGGVSAP